MKQMSEAVYSTILGGAVGDALGVPVEFRKRDTFKITDMIGYGTYDQPPGTWSDDTSMTLCLVETLIETEGDTRLLMQKFSNWESDGYLAPYNHCFDIGRTTMEAISSFREGKHPDECGGFREDDNGNGSLMRIAPVVFLTVGIEDFNLRLKLVEKFSKVTHAHARSILGCIIYIEILYQLYLGCEKNNVLFVVADIINSMINDKYEKEKPHYARILNGSICNLDIKDIRSSGYIVETLEALLWCLLKHDNFQDTVLEAVNLGYDTDTTGIVAGSMAGMYYGLGKKGIPEKWIKKLAKYKMIEKMCRKFADKIEIYT